MKKIFNLLFLLLIIPSSLTYAKQSYFDTKNKSVVCAEPLPEFTLSAKSNPSPSQVKGLCSCIWQSFPENGWEQEISKKLISKQNPGPKLSEFIPKFGEAVQKCGGHKL